VLLAVLYGSHVSVQMFGGAVCVEERGDARQQIAANHSSIPNSVQVAGINSLANKTARVTNSRNGRAMKRH
jgi:hypothetical protein